MTVAVKERGIIFSGESVRQILAGRKTVTRRVVKPQPNYVQTLRDGRFETSPDGGFDIGVGYLKCPYGKAGERLWCRETYFCATGGVDGGPDLIHYKADAKPDLLEVAKAHKLWKSPLFMPRWASRITLELTEVRVERLQDISKEDAVAEGCTATELSPYISADEHETAREQYQRVWDELNAKRGFPWESNPWVWVLSFSH